MRSLQKHTLFVLLLITFVTISEANDQYVDAEKTRFELREANGAKIRFDEEICAKIKLDAEGSPQEVLLLHSSCSKAKDLKGSESSYSRSSNHYGGKYERIPHYECKDSYKTFYVTKKISESKGEKCYKSWKPICTYKSSYAKVIEYKKSCKPFYETKCYITYEKVPEKKCSYGHKKVCKSERRFGGFRRYCSMESCGKDTILGALMGPKKNCGCYPVPINHSVSCKKKPEKRCSKSYKKVPKKNCKKVPTNVCVYNPEPASIPMSTKKCHLEKGYECVSAAKEFAKSVPKKIKSRECYSKDDKDDHHAYSDNETKDKSSRRNYRHYRHQKKKNFEEKYYDKSYDHWKRVYSDKFHSSKEDYDYGYFQKYSYSNSDARRNDLVGYDHRHDDRDYNHHQYDERSYDYKVYNRQHYNDKQYFKERPQYRDEHQKRNQNWNQRENYYGPNYYEEPNYDYYDERAVDHLNYLKSLRHKTSPKPLQMEHRKNSDRRSDDEEDVPSYDLLGS